VSPINAQNRELLQAMRAHLPGRGINLPIYWANRNSEPYFADVLREMYDDGHRTVLAWVTSAYSSYSGCRQYRENLHRALEDAGLLGKMTIDKVRHYFDHPGFLEPVIQDLAEKLQELAQRGTPAEDTVVLFATHSVPNSMGETSGPPARRAEFDTPGGTYAAQHLAAIEIVMAGAITRTGGGDSGSITWSISRVVGAPAVPWLEPDVNDAIREAKAAGKRAVAVVPIGFVSVPC